MNYSNRFILKNLNYILITKKFNKKNLIKKSLLRNSNLKKKKLHTISLKPTFSNKVYQICLVTGYKRSVFKYTGTCRMALKKQIESGYLVNFTSAEW